MSLYVPQNSCSIIHSRNSIACSARMRRPLMYNPCAAPPAAPACHFSCLTPTLLLKMQSQANQARLIRSTPIFTDLFQPSLRLPSQQFPSLPPLPPATRLLLPPSNMHHHSVPPRKHPRPPLLHHRCHNPSENASLHHPLTKMLIGMPGMATLTFALWNSKLMPACDRTGITLLVE